MHMKENSWRHQRADEYQTQKQQTNPRSELELWKMMICVDREKTGTRTKAEPPLNPPTPQPHAHITKNASNVVMRLSKHPNADTGFFSPIISQHNYRAITAVVTFNWSSNPKWSSQRIILTSELLAQVCVGLLRSHRRSQTLNDARFFAVLIRKQ